MNNTVTLSQLIGRLSQTSRVDTATARRFLRAFFDTLTEELSAGDSVTVKGLGTFATTDDPATGHRTVQFAPDAALAGDLNKPFAMFTAVELADDADFSQINTDTGQAGPAPAPAEPEDESAPAGDAALPSEHTEAADETAVAADEPPLLPVDAIEPDIEVETADDEPNRPEPAPEPSQTVADPITSRQNYRVYDRRRNDRKMITVGIVSIIVIAVLSYVAAVICTPVDAYDDGYDETAAETAAVTPDTANTAAITPAPAQTPAEAATQTPAATATPAPADTDPIYDTVEVSLIQLARKHYGGEHIFWVYIYDNNRDVISNPNRIRPGTRVRIPARSTFPGDTPKEAREKAKKRQSEILAQFPN